MCKSILLAVGLAVYSFAQQSAPAASSMLEGDLHNATTGAPVENAKIILAPLAASSSTRASIHFASTNDAGHFALSGIAPGQYRLRADKDGFVPQEYGAKSGDDAGTTLAIGAGGEMKVIDFKLTPQAVIAGRVAGQDGSPVPNARIQCLRNVYTNGHVQFVVVGGGGSNDLGEYRIHGLSPGQYYLHASRHLRSLTQDTYQPLFYPNGVTAESAAPLEVGPGIQLNGIDFVLPLVHAVTLKGRATDGQGQAVASATVTLAVRSGSGVSPVDREAAQTSASGDFEFANVPPGSYFLTATTIPGTTGILTAAAPVEVTSTDENIPLRLNPAGKITGRVTLEEGTQWKEKNVMLQLRPRLGAHPLSAEMNANGAFGFSGVLQDEYTLFVAPPQGMYAKSIRLGDSEIAGSLDFSNGVFSGELKIVLASAAGSVEGTVRDDNGDPAPGMQVVMLPVQASRFDLVRLARSSDDGHYKISFAAPGDYKILAWQGTEPGGYNDPRIRQQLENVAMAVTLDNSSAPHQDLKLAPPVQ
jgi:Carboxypeptidase regulatory-like domain